MRATVSTSPARTVPRTMRRFISPPGRPSTVGSRHNAQKWTGLGGKLPIASSQTHTLPLTPLKRSRPMNLSPQEIDKLYVYVVADLARKRQGRGLKLNYSEAVALISE